MYKPSLGEFRRLARGANVIPVWREVLADMETPVSAFRRVGTGPYGYLLESVEGQEKIARHSFLGRSPSLIFRSKGRQVEIARAGKKGRLRWEKYSAADPLRELGRLLSAYRLAESPELPRLAGGLVGYLGYDAVRFIERLPDQAEDDLGLPDMFFVSTDTMLVFDHLRHRIKIIANVFLDGPVGGGGRRDLEAAYREGVRRIEKVVAALRRGERKSGRRLRKAKGRRGRLRSNFRQEEFERKVRRAKRYIGEGDVIQVVLSQRFQRRVTASGFDIYRALRSVNPSPFMYYLNYDGLQIVGASPEMLVRREGDMLEVRPIAGTRPRGKDEEEDKKLSEELLRDPKEKAEHLMLLDLGRNDVGRISRFSTVRVEEFMTIEKYSHVMHLVSDVRGKLARGKTQMDCIRACFPAGTVSGAPKIRAMEIIEELEPTRRGPYAGAVGYFSFNGNVDTCITIRTVVIKGDEAYIQAGAGIVADSKPRKEYEETMNKARAMLAAIDMAEGEDFE